MLYNVAEISTRLQDITFWKTVFITEITMGTLKSHTEVQFLFLYVGHKASRRATIKRFCVGYAAVMAQRTLWPWPKCIENKCHYVEK